MDESIRLGRVAGVSVGAHWSLLIIFWLIAWNLADGLLPADAPGYSTAAYWIAGVAAALAFFGCLLAHEVSHAVVARRRGLPVEGITLWLFGGVARLGGDAPDAETEFRVAVVGPATSFGIGLVLAVMAGVVSPLGDLVVTTIAWLAGINVLLALFNLVPAFPLDGGRVLRAALWRRSGDRMAATSVALTSGRVFGYGLIGLGLAFATSGALPSGIWFIFLGWFLLAAARAEVDAIEIDELVGDMTVADVMSPAPTTVSAALTVDEVLHRFVLGTRFSAFPVVDDVGNPVGLVTLERIRAVPPERRPHVRVGAIAFPTTELLLVGPSEPLGNLMKTFHHAGGGRALVLDGGQLVGIVSATDLQRTVQRAQLLKT